MKRVFVCLMALLLLGIHGFGQTEIKRLRLGNIVESLAYVSTGPHAGTIAIVDGMQVTGFVADGRGNTPVQTLFDFSKLGFTSQPTGMGYMSDEHLFVFTHPPVASPTATLDLADSKGNPAGSVQFTWPDEFAGTFPYAEGIGWIPSG